jgi:hypothetical protein
MQTKCGLVLLVALALVAPGVLSQDSDVAGTAGAAPYLLQSCAGSSGGALGVGQECMGAGTVGQATPVGVSQGSGIRLTSGFWTTPGVAVSVAGAPTSAGLVTAIGQCSPNPAARFALIQYTLAEPAPVEIEVFAVSGRRVRTLVSSTSPSGAYRVQWDLRDDRGRPVQPGVYFYQLRAGRFSQVKKMVVIN